VATSKQIHLWPEFSLKSFLIAVWNFAREQFLAGAGVWMRAR
jgi:hypothetical protein